MDIIKWLRLREKYRRGTTRLKKQMQSQGVVCLIYQEEPILDTTTTCHDEDEDNNNNNCIACYDARKNCAMFPCGHVTFCQSCFFRYWSENDSCPICRRRVVEYRKIFL